MRIATFCFNYSLVGHRRHECKQLTRYREPGRDFNIDGMFISHEASGNKVEHGECAGANGKTMKGNDTVSAEKMDSNEEDSKNKSTDREMGSKGYCPQHVCVVVEETEA